MTRRRPRTWPIGWGAAEGAVVGGLTGALTYLCLAIIDGAANTDLVYGLQFSAILLAAVVGVVLGVLAGLTGSIAARTADSRPVLVGALAAGGAVGLAIVPVVATWSMHPANVAVPAVTAMAIAAWRLRTKQKISARLDLGGRS